MVERHEQKFYLLESCNLESMSENQPKKRGGLLTLWLVLVLLGYALFLISLIIAFFLFSSSDLHNLFSSVGVPQWSLPLFIIYAIIGYVPPQPYSHGEWGFYLLSISILALLVISSIQLVS